MPVTPGKKEVTAAAGPVGAPPDLTAKTLLGAKNNNPADQANLEQGQELLAGVAAGDGDSRKKLDDLQKKSRSGDKDAAYALAGFAGAAAVGLAMDKAIKKPAAPTAGSPGTPGAVALAPGTPAEPGEEPEEERGLEAPRAEIAAGEGDSSTVGVVIAGLGLAGIGLMVMTGKKKKMPRAA